MTKEEFLYYHDYSSIVDLLNRHMEFHGMTQKETEIEKTANPREFFI